MLNINKFVKEVGENAVDHGWWEEERSFGELIALSHSELSEALEEYRKWKKVNETYYTCKAPKDVPIICQLDETTTCKGCMDAKPEGIPSELTDVVIRLFDICYHYGIDIESMLLEKHQFNKRRPYKHGGKVI